MSSACFALVPTVSTMNPDVHDVAAEPVSPATELPLRMLTRDRIPCSEIDRAWVSRSDDGVIVAGGALSRGWTGGAAFGPSCWIEVMPEHRRIGHATALFAAAVRRSRSLGARAVHSARALARTAESLEVARRLGCTESVDAVHWELNASRVFKECDSIVRRLCARTPGVRDRFIGKALGEWSEPEAESALELQAAELGGGHDELRRRLTPGSPDAFHPTVSIGLFHRDGQAAGVALASLTETPPGGVPGGTLEGLVVSPTFRRGVATPLLKREVARAFIEMRGERFTLITLSPHNDTRRNAERLGPVRTLELVRPYMLIKDVAERRRPSTPRHLEAESPRPFSPPPAAATPDDSE